MLVLARYLNVRGFEYRENITDSHINYIELRIPNQKFVGKISRNDKGIIIKFTCPLIKILTEAYEQRFEEQSSWVNICSSIFHMSYLVGFMPSQIEMNDYYVLLKTLK